MHVSSARADLVLRLFDDYYERVYAFLRKSAPPDVAEDLAQEVFVRLLQHPQLEDLTISVSYLIKIAHNLLRRRFARSARLRELLAERGAPADVADDSPRFVDSTLLDAALGLLSHDEQNAVRLIVCEGKSYQHAAESLGVTVTTVNNWKHRGLTKMRKMLDEAADENARESVRRHAFPGRHEHVRDDLARPTERRAGLRPTVSRRWGRDGAWAAADDHVA
jgi:RNA polymerase sigma factor (sigma-70 family)